MKLELTPEQVDRILNGLAAQPYNVVADLINEIQTQAATQISKEKK